MNHFRRFGRRFAVPSSLQIAHELRALSAEENVRIRCTKEEGLPEAAPDSIAAIPYVAARGVPVG